MLPVLGKENVERERTVHDMAHNHLPQSPEMQWKYFIVGQVRMSHFGIWTQELFEWRLLLEKIMIYLKANNEQTPMRCLDACQFMSKQNLWFLLGISPRTSNMRMYFHP